MESSVEEGHKDRWVAPILSVAQLVSWGAMFYAFAIVLEPLSAELSASVTLLSSTYALGLLVSGLAAFPVGLLIDRGMIRELMTVGSLLAACGLVMHAMAQSVMQLYGAWFVLGLAMSCTLYEPVFAAMIRAYPGSYRNRIAVITLLGGLAGTVFWPLTAWLTAHWGWRNALLVLAALQLLICTPIHWFTVPPTSPTLAARGRADKASLLEAARSRPFVMIVISNASHLFILSAVAGLLVSFLKGIGVSAATTLAVVSTIGPMQVAGRAILLLGGQRLPATRVASIVMWMPVLALTLFVLLSTGIVNWIVVAFAAAMLYGAGNGMMTIIRGTAIADLLGPQRAATLSGIAAVPSAFLRSSGPFVIAAVWEQSQSITLALVAMIAVTVLSAYTYFAAQRAASSSTLRSSSASSAP